MLDGKYGAIAAGHSETAEAAVQILEAGGNAFDAVVGATAAACVCEPVLASLGGGGFMTARHGDSHPIVYDFFVQTPGQPLKHSESDFYPIEVDFGTTVQEFHIGAGSIAVPGLVKGLFAIHQDLGAMPMPEVFAPAVSLARKGVELNPLQAYLSHIVSPILLASRASRQLFGKEDNQPLDQGDKQTFERMADLLETLALEGPDLFYKGEVSEAIAGQCADGGHLKRSDLENYQIIKRPPHSIRYGDFEILVNPPPSSGGILTGFALQLLKGQLIDVKFGSVSHLYRLIAAMDITNKVRVDCELRKSQLTACFAAMEQADLQRYRDEVIGRPQALRGTTHISVADAAGNQASLTLSNGEGCGEIVPGCGFMLNNMLGEEDLNPGGFGLWQADTRMTSMMAPGLMRDYRQERDFVFGSGGSNRIRSAILQVLLNITEFDMHVEDAVGCSRLHFENDKLNIETGFDTQALLSLQADFPDAKIWDEHNLYFGGVHTVMSKDGHFDGAGDFRRGGVYRVS